MEKALTILPDDEHWRRDFGSTLRDLAMTVALFTENMIEVPAMAGILDTLEDELRKSW